MSSMEPFVLRSISPIKIPQHVGGIHSSVFAMNSTQDLSRNQTSAKAFYSEAFQDGLNLQQIPRYPSDERYLIGFINGRNLLCRRLAEQLQSYRQLESSLQNFSLLNLTIEALEKTNVHSHRSSSYL